MKIIPLFLSLLILNLFVKGQSACTPTNNPGQIYYPYTTSTSTGIPGYQYLCGPNTVVFDTVSPPALFTFNVYANSGTTLNLTAQNPTIHQVWLKSGSTLNILPGSSGVQIMYESGAIINNPSGSSTVTTLCPSIVFPIVSCATNLYEITTQQALFRTWPNPSTNILNIELLNSDYTFVDLYIFNQLGEIIFQKDNWLLTNKIISTDFLASGSYFLNVRTEQGQQTQKLIVIR